MTSDYGLPTSESITDLHYRLTRLNIIKAVSEIESALTSQDSEYSAISLVSILIYAGSENIDKTFLDMKEHVSERGYAFLISALGFISLGNAKTAIVKLLENLIKDENIHIRESAENSLDMIKFDLN